MRAPAEPDANAREEVVRQIREEDFAADTSPAPSAAAPRRYGPVTLPSRTNDEGAPPAAAELDALRKVAGDRPFDRGGRNQLLSALARAHADRELVDRALDWQLSDPDNPMVYEFAGDGYARLHDATNALRACASIVDVSPGDSGLVNRAGFLALRAGQAEMAANLFRFAIERRPDHANNYRGLALALWLAGKHEDAAHALDDALGQDYLLRETDANDVDLHVLDPNGEECDYSHKACASGLHLYEDLTAGFGPECTVVPAGRLAKGIYHVGVKYYSPARWASRTA